MRHILNLNLKVGHVPDASQVALKTIGQEISRMLYQWISNKWSAISKRQRIRTTRVSPRWCFRNLRNWRCKNPNGTEKHTKFRSDFFRGNYWKVESKSPVTQKDSFEIDMFVGLMKFKDSRKFSFEKLEDVRKKHPKTPPWSQKDTLLWLLWLTFFLLTMQHAAVMQPRLHSHEIGTSEPPGCHCETHRRSGKHDLICSPWMKGIGFASPEDEHFAHISWRFGWWFFLS